MHLRKRKTEAAERFAERRRREDDAPRLKDRVPELATLKLDVEESHDTAGTARAKHVRHIVVDRAPALFALPCGDASCTGGGYDITDAVMRALLAHEEHFEAEDRCYGSIGNAPCRRSLHVVGTATYRKSE
jgi:hypothetical protein